MKLFSILMVSTLALPTFAKADSLFNYIAYAKKSILAECSDFNGKVGAGGTVELADFLVRSAHYDSCALVAKTSVNMHRGGVQYENQSWSCIASPRVIGTGSFIGQRNTSATSFDNLNNEMDQISSMLSNTRTSGDVVVMDISEAAAKYKLSNGTITLLAKPGQTLVINVHGKNVVIRGLGIQLAGGVTARNIIWNFIEAETLSISNSGADQAHYGNLGIPGTFLAPLATVSFNDAAITGALFAAKIVGKAANPGVCVGTVSGQINEGGCLLRGSLGIGCSPDQQQQPGDQRQQPDQRQEPVPGQQQQ